MDKPLDDQGKLKLLRDEIRERMALYDGWPGIYNIFSGNGLSNCVRARREMCDLLESAVAEHLYLRDSVPKLINLLFIDEERMARRVRETCLPLRELWKSFMNDANGYS